MAFCGQVASWWLQLCRCGTSSTCSRGDVYWCTADCGWVTGHTYLAYGPLLCGAQTVIFDGVPNHPTPARCWQIVEKYRVRCPSSLCAQPKALLTCGTCMLPRSIAPIWCSAQQLSRCHCQLGAVLPRGSLRCAKPVLWVGCQGAEVKAVAKFLSVARQVRQFYTAPTLVRALEAQDDHFVTDHNRSSLRILGTVGEPINPRAWLWFFKVSTLRPLPTCVSADGAPLLLGSFALGDCNLAAPPDGVAPAEPVSDQKSS